MTDFASLMTWRSPKDSCWRCKNAVIEGTKAYYDDPNGTTLFQAEITELIRMLKIRVRLILAINSLRLWCYVVAMEKNWALQNPQANFDKVSKTTMDLGEESNELCQSPLSANTWTSLQARSRSLTMVQMSMPMMLPTLKVGTYQVVWTLW